MKKIDTTPLTAALLLLAEGSQAIFQQIDTFNGPGIVECNMGDCVFSVKSRLSCSDPCHTKHSRHMYDFSFEDLASDVSGDVHLRNGQASNDGITGEPCYHTKARNINTDFPHSFVEIEAGCTARCRGCEFEPTVVLTGPGNLSCTDGRCTKYMVEDEVSNFNCGRGIEKASKEYGSFHTVLDGSDVGYSFYGYEGINTNNRRRTMIPEGCTLDCSGCSLQKV